MEGQQNESLVQRQNCCCLTGHRSLPSDPDQLAELRQNLRRLICDLAQQGITTFYTGGCCTSKLRNTPTGCIWSAWNILLSV